MKRFLIRLLGSVEKYHIEMANKSEEYTIFKMNNFEYESKFKSHILFMVGNAIHNFKYYNQRQSEITGDNAVVSKYHAEIITETGRFLGCISRGCDACGSHHYKLDVEYDGFKYGTNAPFDKGCENYSLTQIDNILFIVHILMKAAHNLLFNQHEVRMIENVLGIQKEEEK